MAIEIPRHQPIVPFAAVRHCTHCAEYDYMQPVQTKDEQRVFFKRKPIAPPSVISGGSFSLAGMTESGGTITATGPGSALATPGVSANKTYMVRLTVEMDEVDVTGGWRVKVNNQYVKLPDVPTGSYSIYNGTVTSYITMPGSITVDQIAIEVTGSTTELRIRDVSVTELGELQVQLLSESKSVITTFSTGIVNYSNSPFGHVEVDWEALNTSGIRYLRFNDSTKIDVNLISNGTFNTDLAGWENDFGDWAWESGAGGRAFYDNASPQGNALGKTILNVPGGGLYHLQFSVSGIGFGEGLRVVISANGDEISETIYTLTNSYTQTIDLTGFPDFNAIGIAFYPLNPTDTVYLDTVSFRRKYDIGNDSIPLDVQDKHPLTLALYAICDTGTAYGFTYGEGFYHALRVKAELNYTAYPDNTTMYDFSNNESDLLRAIALKNYLVSLKGVAEYVHDAVRVMRLCDTFTINAKEYIHSGAYELGEDESLLLRSAKFQVRDKVALETNYY